MRATFIVFSIVFSFDVASTAAQDASTFLSDRKTDCKLNTAYDSEQPGPREFEWSGACVDGLAEGFGTITYFVDNRPYWTFNVVPDSGAEIRKGEFQFKLDPTKFNFRMTACNRTSMQVTVEIPAKIDLQFSELFWEVIKAGSDYGASQTIPQQNGDCLRYSRSGDLWRREKEIIILQSEKQIGWAKSTRSRQKPNNSFEYGSEIWTNWNNHKIIAAQNNRIRVVNAVIQQQQAFKREEIRQAQAQAAMARQAAEAERLAAIQAAEAAHLAAIEKKTQELITLAEADARERDGKRPADSFCIFSCDPTEQNGRLAFSNRLKSILKTPAIVLKFRKSNGVRGELNGVKTYELHFKATVELPQGFISKPGDGVTGMLGGANAMGLTMQLKRLMEYEMSGGKDWWDPTSLEGTGKIMFRKTEQGWEGYDGAVYSK